MNSDFHVLNLTAYQTPEIYEDPHSDFVGYGDDNDFYTELINAFLNSPTTNSIVTGVVGQIMGKGFSALDASRKPDEFASFKNLFKAKDLKRICMDYKLLGEAAFQVTYRGKKVVQVSHFNRETLRAEKCDDKGKINAYYYSPKWSEHKQGDKLTRIPVFGSGAANEIYIIRRFIPSMHYYSPPDWVSALNYSNLECEISAYLVNEVNNSFSGTKLVSFTNGVPTQEKQHAIKQEILNKLSGSNGEKIIVSFSDSPDNKTTIEDISVSDAADVYEYISEECTKKLLLANRITSPLLVGIRDGSGGLGSNSEEILNAHNLFENVVIKPYQSDIIDAIEEILAVNGISLKIFVQTLTPIEFTDETLVTQEQKEEETGQKLSLAIEIDGKEAYHTKEEAIAVAEIMGCTGFHEMEMDGKVYFMPCESHDLKKPCWDGYEMVGYKTKNGQKVPNCVPIKNSKEDVEMSDDFPHVSDEMGAEMIQLMDQVGEEEDLDNYELISVEDASDEPEDFHAEQYLNKLKLSKPQTDSSLDSEMFKVRYKYVRGRGVPANKKGNKSRDFCENMMSKSLIYRKEDVDFLSFQGVNKDFGHKGKPYSLFKWKGGSYCHHIWERRVYMKKLNKQGEAWGGAALVGTDKISVQDAIRRGFKLPKQPSEVGQAPIMREDKGKY